MRFALFFTAIIVTISVFLSDQCIAANDRWWEKDNEGWFFYKNQVIPKEDEADETVKKETLEESSQPYLPSHPLKQKLFTEQVKEKGSELLSTAMQYPTSENIRNYLRWNKFMIDVSSNFAVAWQKELMRNPELAYDMPIVDADKDIYIREKSKEADRIIYDLAERAGLFFFYKFTCPYCQRQAQYLKEFSDKYGFQVKAVSMDRGIYPEFPDALMENGISVRLGVDRVPAVFLAFPDEKRFERLSAGIVTFAELRQRVLLHAKEINSDINYVSFVD
jgi:conjugal transfer pilus assembly protein TraF